MTWPLWLSVLALVFVGSSAPVSADPANGQDQAERTGAQVYQSGCAVCHGAHGQGEPSSLVGISTPLPDFSDCRFATAERDLDWISMVRFGGPVRGFGRKMPAFDDALSSAEIHSVVDYLRGFCTNPSWPAGDLNLPRSLVTEKAFPEDEALMTTRVPTSERNAVNTDFVYERRLGPRSQYSVVVPFNVRMGVSQWNQGLGDIAVGFKQVVFARRTSGTILSASGGMTFPTGKEVEFLGNRLRVFEPSAMFSQMLPGGGFLHAQAGFTLPMNHVIANNEVYWRFVVGRTFTQPDGGRAWSPMIEILGNHEFDFGEPRFWDLLPEMQVTLSRRQHVMMSGGVRFPVNLRRRLPTTAIVSLQWEWREGGLLSGW